jgi:hypothetical protein
MVLSPLRKEKCLRIIQKLLRHSISRIFSEPVDPVLDHCPDYFEIIDHPMDLGTVRRNLESNSYSKFSDFYRDVERIWGNAIRYSGLDSQIATLARQLQIWFHEMTSNMSDNESQDWVSTLTSISSRLSDLSDAYPSESPEAEVESIGEKRPKSRKDPSIIEEIAQTSKVPERGQKTQKDPQQKIQKRVQSKKISLSETGELVDQINSLEDFDQIQKVLSIIRKCEPDFELGKDITVDLLALSMATRVSIRDYLGTLDN